MRKQARSARIYRFWSWSFSYSTPSFWAEFSGWVASRTRRTKRPLHHHRRCHRSAVRTTRTPSFRRSRRSRDRRLNPSCRHCHRWAAGRLLPRLPFRRRRQLRFRQRRCQRQLAKRDLDQSRRGRWHHCRRLPSHRLPFLRVGSRRRFRPLLPDNPTRCARGIPITASQVVTTRR